MGLAQPKDLTAMNFTKFAAITELNSPRESILNSRKGKQKVFKIFTANKSGLVRASYDLETASIGS